MDKGDSQLKFAKRSATSDELVGIVGAAMALDSALDEELYLSVGGGPCFLTSCGSSNQSWHSDF